jgi:nitrite reductase/ring-hydroxylating ferredoxin subunit
MESIESVNRRRTDQRWKGVRFPLTAGSDDAVGFVIRYADEVHAYLNRCAHVPVELDWNPGEFIESSGLYIMCATHGAIYQPETDIVLAALARAVGSGKLRSRVGWSGALASG